MGITDTLDNEPRAAVSDRVATMVEEFMHPPKGFEPARYLSRVNGAEYLEVKWRLVWLRDHYPDANIETEMIHYDQEWALCFCRISIPGGGMSTGYGSESRQDFRDYIEKSETKAIGRALAALGFGTQFCPDHDFGAAQGRVVDSPIRPRTPSGRTYTGSGAVPNEMDGGNSSMAASSDQASQRQLRYLQAVAREAGMSMEDLDLRCREEFECDAAMLSRRDASTMIDVIKPKANQTRN